MLENLKKSRAKQLEYQERLKQDKARSDYEELDVLVKQVYFFFKPKFKLCFTTSKE